MGITNDEISKMVHEYLARFHQHYRVARHGSDDIEEWCESNLGTKYKEWSFYKGHRDDKFCVIHILDPKRCTLFELRWSDRILGTLDIGRKRL